MRKCSVNSHGLSTVIFFRLCNSSLGLLSGVSILMQVIIYHLKKWIEICNETFAKFHIRFLWEFSQQAFIEHYYAPTGSVLHARDRRRLAQGPHPQGVCGSVGSQIQKQSNPNKSAKEL